MGSLFQSNEEKDFSFVSWSDRRKRSLLEWPVMSINEENDSGGMNGIHNTALSRHQI